MVGDVAGRRFCQRNRSYQYPIASRHKHFASAYPAHELVACLWLVGDRGGAPLPDYPALHQPLDRLVEERKDCG
jgi:hypothetical protein